MAPVAQGVGLEQLPQLRDVVVDDLRRSQRRLVPPDGVDEPLRPDDLVRAQDEIVRSPEVVSPGDSIDVEVAEGRFGARVE